MKLESVMKSVTSWAQCDYFLAFKLEVVGQVEREGGELTYKQTVLV